MTPTARLAAAANILDGLNYSRLIDPQLKVWARENRFAGSGDRRAIADRVYSCVRRRQTSAAQGGGPSGRAMVVGNMVLEDGLTVDQIASLCTGGYGLNPLTEAERVSLATAPEFESDAVRLDWPEWLMPEAAEAFGTRVDQELDALRQRASLDVRANTLTTTREEAQNSLASEGISATPLSVCDTALRIPAGTSILRTKAYLSGLIDIQDAASQAVAAFAMVCPGQTVLDYCAGAGGKTLALSALMQNQGKLVAHDVDPRRMAEIPDRAKRCDATIIERSSLKGYHPATFDAVLVDAPCSGSGSWRRDPLGKWRLTAGRLSDLRAAQFEALGSAMKFVRPGGTLTYATCSVLPAENQAQVTTFLADAPEFELEGTLSLWPARDQTDGFFAARFRHNGR